MEQEKAQKTRWSKERCRQRYVEGDDCITLAQLSEISGRSLSTLGSWSNSSDTSNKGIPWNEQRSIFNRELIKKTSEQVTAKMADKLSEGLVDLALDNYEAHKLEKQIAMLSYQIHKDNLLTVMDLPPSPEREQRFKVVASSSNYVSLLLSRATNGMAIARGLGKFVDINAAIERVRQQGYEVIDPSAVEDEADLD